MAQPVLHFELSTKNRSKSQAFYRSLFDWEIKELPDMEYSLVSPAGEKSIGGGIAQVQNGQPPALTIYTEVDDLQKYLDRAESLGGKTAVPPTQIPNVGSFAMFSDPDGIVMGLFKSGDQG